MSFVHLHAHSEYSMLDGLGNIKELVGKAQDLNMPAIAITDHGCMHGCFSFYVAAKKAGIKPILGMEAYLTAKSMADKTGDDRGTFHLLLLAKDLRGYKNLMQISTLSHLHGFYYKPRIDKAKLREHAEGLISSSGCIQGEIPQAILEGNYEKAQTLTKEYIDIFGKENFFIELQRHQLHNPEGELYQLLEKLNPQLIKLAKEFDLRIVATNDVHYVNAEDAEAQDALLAVQTKEILNDPNRKLSMLDSPDYYVKSRDEMLEMFPGIPEAIDNSLHFADLVTDDYEIPMGEMIFPHYETPDGLSEDDYLRKIVYERVGNKFDQVTDEVRDRIDKELTIIADKGYSSYTLIFEDLATFCRDNDIIASARGSAAGSLVHYILDISFLDPLKYNIPFERYLNPARPTPPDIDLDMEDVHRDTIIQYTVDRFGADKVAQIVTFGSMEARAAVRDIGRVMGMPYSFCDKIAKLILPPKQGFHVTIEDSIEQMPELNELYNDNPEVKKLLDMATRIQGVKRHAGVHAAGVIIADKEITEYVPLMKDRRTDKRITQYDMKSLDLNAVDDAIGLLKMDYLGLRNLSILNETVRMIKKYQGLEVDPFALPLDDNEVYELLRDGDTTGVFQMESGGFRQLARELKPDRFEDISVMLALYRPGPMDMIPSYIERKQDESKIEYPHDALKEVLGDTYGIIVYQEQCMQIANVMAGYTLGEGDLLRRAIGKKKKDLMEIEKNKFIEGAQEQGFTKEDAITVFEFIEKFAVYGFNRAHSASYGLVTYQTAYMKVKYPYEFFSALLTCERNNTEKIAFIVNELRQKGINVLGPNVNSSQTSFQIETDEEGNRAIRFGLSAIKNVGDAAMEGIVNERDANGVFTDFYNFCQRVGGAIINRKGLESLIYAGALTDLGPRSALLKVMDEYLEAGSQYQKMQSIGQQSLFGAEETVTMMPQVSKLSNIGEVSEDQILQWEKDVLGFYLTKHPHEKNIEKMRDVIKVPISDLGDPQVGSEIVLGGIVETKKEILTKKDSREMCFLTLNDLSASLEVIVFPNTYENGGQQIEQDGLLIVQGKLESQDDGSHKVIANKLLIPEFS